MRKHVGPPKLALARRLRGQFPRTTIAQAVGAKQYFGDSMLARISDRSTMMADKDKKASRVKDSRQDRLKDKLRENLKRRKSQARERVKMTDAPSHDEDASPHGEVGKPGS
jgi:spore germination cell wall hydrolase CwlJ-like protein